MKGLQIEEALIYSNRCYDRAILKKLSIFEFLQLYLCPKDAWEKQEKTQMQRKQ